MELGVVHRFSDVDPATSPSRHSIPRNISEDLEEAGHLGGRAS